MAYDLHYQFSPPPFRKAPENRLACLQFEALLSFSVAQTKRQNAWATTTHLRQTHAEILAKLLVALATFGGFIGGKGDPRERGVSQATEWISGFAVEMA